MRLKALCADEMPREKMLTKGSGALSNAELLAILLRVGRNGKNAIDVARELLLSGDGSIETLAGMSIERLCAITGIGPTKAVTIAAAFELGRRANTDSSQESAHTLNSPKAVFRLMRTQMRHLSHEECWILLLSKNNRLISKECVSVGGQDSTIIDNRIIIRKAIDRKAAGIILVHNHPSGNAIPSVPDIRQTESLNKALKTCDLSLLDHIIIAKDTYYTFADEELTETNKERF